LRNQENVTPNPGAEKRGTSLHFVVKPNITQKIKKKEKKTHFKIKKKEEGRLPFSTWAEKLDRS